MIARTTAFCWALCSGTLLASMDHYEPFATLAWADAGGYASIAATQTSDGMTSLKVVAFGRTIEASQKDLEVFKGFRANGLIVMGGGSRNDVRGAHFTVQFLSNQREVAAGKGRFMVVLSDGTYALGTTSDETFDKLFPR